MTTPAGILHPLNFTILSFSEEEHDYHFHVEAQDPNVCPICGSMNELVKFGKKDVSYRDVPIHGKRVTLWLQRRRYRCNACMGTFRPTLADLDEKRQMTKRLVSYVEKAVLVRANTDLARECGIGEQTVRAIFADFSERHKDKLDFVTPRVLGIDELYLQKVFRCVLTNIEESTVIELLPSRHLELVTKTFAELSKKEDVEVLSIDMYRNYLDAGRASLPWAKPVVDKFHVIKMANEALEQVRKGIKKGLPEKDRRILKNDRKLMLMRRRDLTPAQELIVLEWFDRIPQLGAAYEAKEAFYKLYEARDIKDAIEAYDEWRGKIPESQAAIWNGIAGTVERWRGPIFNYFLMDKKVTNAFTEAANRKMKDLNRSARGMSFEVFRAKVLFAAKHKVVKTKVRKSSPFYSQGGMGMGRMTISSIDTYEETIHDYGTPISTVIELMNRDAV